MFVATAPRILTTCEAQIAAIPVPQSAAIPIQHHLCGLDAGPDQAAGAVEFEVRGRHRHDAAAGGWQQVVHPPIMRPALHETLSYTPRLHGEHQHHAVNVLARSHHLPEACVALQIWTLQSVPASPL